MKKYRLTKITVKTREMISLPKNTAGENQEAVCPLCHTHISVSLPLNNSSAVFSNDRQPAELPAAAAVSANQNNEFKGDL